MNMGDYEATLFSTHSHNRGFGEAFVKKERFDKLDRVSRQINDADLSELIGRKLTGEAKFGYISEKIKSSPKKEELCQLNT